MAKRSKTKKDEATEKAAKKKPTPPIIEKPDYGVAELAEALDVDASVARQKLRAAGMTKEGRAWDFKNKKGLDAVVKKLKSKD